MIKIKYRLTDEFMLEDYITFNSFEEINDYDKVLWMLYYSEYCGKSLTLLPRLPNSIVKFYCNYDSLTKLPELPKSLKVLYCGENKLTSLPELPNSLKLLRCNNNKFIKKHKYLRNIIYI